MNRREIARRRREADAAARAARIEVRSCMFPACSRDVECRGLCSQHYNNARCSVQAGAVTWDQLVAAGKCLRAGPKGAQFAERGAARKWFEEAAVRP